MTNASSATVRWTHMADGTGDDYERLSSLFEIHTKPALVPNLVNMLTLLEGPRLGYQIDRYQHSLQSATRAHRNGESIDLVVGSVLHDIADSFAPDNHSEAAAVLLAPYVDERTSWIVKHHGLFQGHYYFHHFGGDRNAREEYSESPHYDACVDFCDSYDANCFDPNYDTMAIEDFIPMLDEVFARPSRVPLIAASVMSERSDVDLAEVGVDLVREQRD